MTLVFISSWYRSKELWLMRPREANHETGGGSEGGHG